MNKIICILLAAITLAFGTERNAPERYRISYPRYIPAYSSFEVSLITTNYYPDADTLEVYMIPDSKVSLVKIELRSVFKKKILKFSPADLPGANYQAYKTVINLADTVFTPGLFFQLLFGLNSESSSQSEIKIMGVFKQNGVIIGRINPDALNGFADEYIKAKLYFYKPQKNAGSALQFTGSSRLKISGLQTDAKNLLIDFWFKETGGSENIFSVGSLNDPNLSYSLSTNSFQMLSVTKNGNLIENLNSLFLSNKNWYHLTSDFQFADNSIMFYCNGSFVGKTGLQAFTNPGDLTFNFGSPDAGNSFTIDLLRFVNLGNTIDVAFANRNYMDFIADSSSVIYQFSFDNGDNLNISTDGIKTETVNLRYVRSNAPIFARAPELNISILNSSYSLRWSGGDYQQADHYVLQKSANNSEFKDIYQAIADNSDPSEYSFTDSKDETADVVYYRVKQVNSDGSAVYSSQVKVGQGALEPFVVQPNYPNPFNPKTSIVVNFLVGSQADITVYNLEGKEITKLFKGFLPQGSHTFSFDGTDLPSGVYLYKITTPAYSEIKKMVLTK